MFADYGNRLHLLDEEILANLADIQLRNGLRPSASLASGDFTVEMETGTGKTYVYVRTIFELNRRYGFTKFVIVVPSVAIKEGVYKTLQITEEPSRRNSLCIFSPECTPDRSEALRVARPEAVVLLTQ